MSGGDGCFISGHCYRQEKARVFRVLLSRLRKPLYVEAPLRDILSIVARKGTESSPPTGGSVN